jgi:hypothetical protein
MCGATASADEVFKGTGQCHEIFDFWYFHESVSPKPLSIPLGRFELFRKFAEIFAAQGAPPLVSLTPVAKIFNHKSFNYLVWTPLGSRAGVVDTSGAP